jgi:hypothetical protein
MNAEYFRRRQRSRSFRQGEKREALKQQNETSQQRQKRLQDMSGGQTTG